MKKSLKQAINNAIVHSRLFPDITVYVMDKPRKKAVVSTVDWIVRERILEGYSTVARYRNGKKI